MNTQMFRLHLALLTLFCTCAVFAPARAADFSSEPVILVAKREMRDTLYGATILIVRNLGNDAHVGFIVNRPTATRLGELFPADAPSQKVPDPVYLGGPFNTEMIFALVKRSESPGGRSFQLTQDLFVATDAATVDRIIAAESGHARFFAGLVAWQPGELRAELKRGLWYVLEPEADLVLRKSTENLWDELVSKSERYAKGI